MLSAAHAREIVELLEEPEPDAHAGRRFPSNLRRAATRKRPDISARPPFDPNATRAHTELSPAGTPTGLVVSARTQRGQL
jgi:hypothetical protein